MENHSPGRKQGSPVPANILNCLPATRRNRQRGLAATAAFPNHERAVAEEARFDPLVAPEHSGVRRAPPHDKPDNDPPSRRMATHRPTGAICGSCRGTAGWYVFRRSRVYSKNHSKKTERIEAASRDPKPSSKCIQENTCISEYTCDSQAWPLKKKTTHSGCHPRQGFNRQTSQRQTDSRTPPGRRGKWLDGG